MNPLRTNPIELEVKARYEKAGWRILTRGAPDFVLLKVDPAGEITDDMVVEVKSSKARLSYEQKVYRRFLERHGIRYKVEVIRRRDPHGTRS